MATVTNIEPEASSDGQRQRSEIRFPARSLADSVAVAKAIHEQGGGKATADQLAAFLEYKSTSNGAYIARVGAARMFGLIAKSGEFFVVTPLGNQILMPTYSEQARQGLVTAFLNVELFKAAFEEFKGKELPPEFGMKNALRNTFHVVPKRIEIAYRVLMDSAQDAGFFSTRGARTHLIMPPLQVAPPPPPPPAASDDGFEDSSGGSGGGGGDNFDGGGGDSGKPAQLLTNLGAVKARYIQTLINVLEEKGKSGDLDEALMSRIEKLLGDQK